MLLSMGSQKFGNDLATKQQTATLGLLEKIMFMQVLKNSKKITFGELPANPASQLS